MSRSAIRRPSTPGRSVLRSATVPALTLVALLAVPGPASAHVTVAPDEAPAGSYAVLDVRVPNERDDEGTTKVQLQLPPGVSSAAYEPVPDWTAVVTRRPPVRPFTVDGAPATDEVDTITWTGRGRAGVVAPGQFRRFPVSLRIPDGAAGTTIAFKALQTYEDGEVVRWIGGAGSDLPAPTLALGEPEDEDAAHGATPVGAGSEADGGDDGGDALPIALGAAGLLAGLAGAGLALAGRRRTT